MGRELRGEARKLRRPDSERSDPSRYDDAPASHVFSVCQNDSETCCVLCNFDDLSLFQVGNRMRLEPATVSNKACDGDSPTHTHASRSLKRVDRQCLGGIRQLRGFPARSPTHSSAHFSLPKSHALT